MINQQDIGICTSVGMSIMVFSKNDMVNINPYFKVNRSLCSKGRQNIRTVGALTR